MKILTSVIMVLLLGACSSVPKKLRVAEGISLLPYETVKNSPTSHKNSTVRWGGEIVSTINHKDSTMVEVVNLKLSSSSKPKVKNESSGRFRLYYKGLLDPVIYKKGNMLTVVGTINGQEPGKIGEHEYSYPVVNAQSIHVWKNIKQIKIKHDDPFYNYGYWGHYAPYPYHQRVRGYY